MFEVVRVEAPAADPATTPGSFMMESEVIRAIYAEDSPCCAQRKVIGHNATLTTTSRPQPDSAEQVGGTGRADDVDGVTVFNSIALIHPGCAIISLITSGGSVRRCENGDGFVCL